MVEWSFVHACKASCFLCMVILSLEVAQRGEHYQAFFRLHQKYLATRKLLLKTLTIAQDPRWTILGIIPCPLWLAPDTIFICTVYHLCSADLSLYNSESAALNSTHYYVTALSVLFLAVLISVDLSSDGSANYFTSMSTWLTSSCYRGALYASPFFLAKCKILLVSKAPDHFLYKGLLKPTCE